MKSLVIGASNCAAQAYRWSNSVDQHCDIRTLSIGPTSNGWDFEIHKSVDLQILHRKLSVNDTSFDSFRTLSEMQSYLKNRFSHFLIEYFNPIINWGCMGSAKEDKNHLEKLGKFVAYVAHGSDLIVPSIHADIERFSPHRSLSREINDQLESRAVDFQAAIAEHGTLTFVSTLNLLDFAPDAIWLPVVAKSLYFLNPIQPMRKVPLVVHAPSDPIFKGTAYLEPILYEMNKKGVIRYIRCNRLDSSQLHQLICRADIIIDQISLGSYGVLAVDAMAAGKIVLGHVSSKVRSIYKTPVPIVEISPETLEGVLLDLLSQPTRINQIQTNSRAFSYEYHSGRFAALQLQKYFLA